jgi:hypothetical protein
METWNWVMGNLYFMLPMEKLNIALSTSNMNSLLRKANPVAKWGCNKTTIILHLLAHVRPIPSPEKKHEYLNAGSCLVVMGSKQGEVKEQEVVIP